MLVIFREWPGNLINVYISLRTWLLPVSLTSTWTLLFVSWYCVRHHINTVESAMKRLQSKKRKGQIKLEEFCVMITVVQRHQVHSLSNYTKSEGKLELNLLSLFLERRKTPNKVNNSWGHSALCKISPARSSSFFKIKPLKAKYHCRS